MHLAELDLEPRSAPAASAPVTLTAGVAGIGTALPAFGFGGHNATLVLEAA